MQIKSKPTQLYGIFEMAEDRHITVEQLLSGRSSAFSYLEYVFTQLYYRAKRRINQEQKK